MLSPRTIVYQYGIGLIRRTLLIMVGRIKHAIGMSALLMLCSSLIAADNPIDMGDAPTEARLKVDIFYLASKECEGRGPATQGIDRAANHIANQFKAAGLKALGADNSFFQPFTIPGMILDAPAKLAFRGPGESKIEPKAGEFTANALTTGGELKDVPVVFAGYGIKSGELKYNDYDNLDVRDKLVLVLRDTPKAGKAEAKTWEPLGSLTKKIQTAEKEGAAGLVFVNDSATADDELPDHSWLAYQRQPTGKIPVYHLARKVAESLFEKSDKSLEDREAAIVENLKPESGDLKGVTASGQIKATFGKIPLKNVVGVVEGNGPLANETIVVGSHYDHLGYGGTGGSLARVKKPVVHPGADDNGSGTTAMMELARRFASMKDRQGRRVVFMAFSGEELGLFGSKHYCENPLLPLDKTVAMLNLDMVGRLPRDMNTGKDLLLVEANTTAKEWNGIVEKLNEKHGFKLKMDSKGIKGDSDHFSFYKKNLPVLFLWTGIHPDYHRPTDVAEKIDLPGMRKIVNIGTDLVKELSTTTSPPKYQKTTEGGGGGSARGPRIGIMPDYNSDKEGVLLEGVSDGGPAEKAGLKKGDLIVEVAGKPVKDLMVYLSVMTTQKAGQEVEFVVLRDGKRVTIKVKPE